MYYEEKFIDGKLMCRTMPDGEWQQITTSVALAANQLMLLSDEERYEVFSHFCKHCGCDDPRCRCWDDS